LSKSIEGLACLYLPFLSFLFVRAPITLGPTCRDFDFSVYTCMTGAAYKTQEKTIQVLHAPISALVLHNYCFSPPPLLALE
jgi:hypothetical protein